MKNHLSLVLVSTLALGCATQQAAVVVGPAATVRDSAHGIEFSRAELCVLAAIDGKQIPTSIEASLRNSGYGKLRATVIERKVAAQPMKATIACRSASVRPFDYSRKVTGVVSFEPKADTLYVVNGSIGEERVSVWIENAETKERVSSEIVNNQP